MSSEFLTTYKKNADEFLVPLLAAFADNPGNREYAQMISFLYRQKGSCSFLVSGRSIDFYSQISKGACAYLHFLELAEKKQKLTSDNSAFFDAVCCRDDQASRKFSEMGIVDFQSDYEYEEDYLYTKFLMSFFFLDLANGECEKILVDLENTLGDDVSRFDLLTSYANRDSEAFEDAFISFLQSRSETIEKLIVSGGMKEQVWSWARYISVEGLAHLRFAERLNFEIPVFCYQVPELLKMCDTTMVELANWQSL